MSYLPEQPLPYGAAPGTQQPQRAAFGMGPAPQQQAWSGYAYGQPTAFPYHPAAPGYGVPPHPTYGMPYMPWAGPGPMPVYLSSPTQYMQQMPVVPGPTGACVLVPCGVPGVSVLRPLARPPPPGPQPLHMHAYHASPLPVPPPRPPPGGPKPPAPPSIPQRQPHPVMIHKPMAASVSSRLAVVRSAAAPAQPRPPPAGPPTPDGGASAQQHDEQQSQLQQQHQEQVSTQAQQQQRTQQELQSVQEAAARGGQHQATAQAVGSSPTSGGSANSNSSDSAASGAVAAAGGESDHVGVGSTPSPPSTPAVADAGATAAPVPLGDAAAAAQLKQCAAALAKLPPWLLPRQQQQEALLMLHQQQQLGAKVRAADADAVLPGDSATKEASGQPPAPAAPLSLWAAVVKASAPAELGTPAPAAAAVTAASAEPAAAPTPEPAAEATTAAACQEVDVSAEGAPLLSSIKLLPPPADAGAAMRMRSEFQFALFASHSQYVMALLQPAAAAKLSCLMRLSTSDLQLLLKQPQPEQLLDALWEMHSVAGQQQ